VRSRLLRNMLWSMAVLAVLAGLSLGLPALDNAVASARPVPAGVRYAIGDGVSLLPPAGAQVDVTHTGQDQGTALFLLGSVRYSIRALPFTGTLDDVTAQLRRSITATRGYQVTGVEVPVRTEAGVPGRQGGYTSPGRQGRYYAFLAAGTAVEVTFAGGDLELHHSLQALEASVRSIAFGRS
jgi:hypothetical protein